MPKVEIESFWDRLGVELWPNYCFETQKLDFARGGGFVHLYQRPILRLHWGVLRSFFCRILHWLQWGSVVHQWGYMTPLGGAKWIRLWLFFAPSYPTVARRKGWGCLPIPLLYAQKGSTPLYQVQPATVGCHIPAF